MNSHKNYIKIFPLPSGMASGRRRSKMSLRKKRSLLAKETAQHLVELLFLHAERIASLSLQRATHYVDIARKAAMKVKIRLPSVYKHRYCRYCYAYLVPGGNCRIRLRNGIRTIYCSSCRKFSRFPYAEKYNRAVKAKKKLQKSEKTTLVGKAGDKRGKKNAS